MKQRKKILRVLWLALQDAKDYEISFMDAWGNDKKEPVVKKALKNVAEFEELQKMIFGNQKSICDVFAETSKTIDIFELLQTKEIPK